MSSKIKERLSSSQKNADKKAWYREQLNILDGNHYDINRGYGGVSEFKRMKVNYDLFNNILNLEDFEYVCKPFGAEAGELPATMVNRDITSGKINAMLGMEAKRAFTWNILAVNPEATTRKEQEEFGRMRDFVISQIMGPIRQRIEIERAQQEEGRQLTPEEIQRIQQEVEEELQAQTPEEVKKYMKREHQDPSEVMHTQLLNYLIQKCDTRRKFNTALKHGLLSAVEPMFIGEFNGEPEVWNVNPMKFSCSKNSDQIFIEDGEWATAEFNMTPSEIIKYFGHELKDSEIDSIYNSWTGNRRPDSSDLFAMDDYYNDYDDTSDIKVLHAAWKSLRKIGFLTYIDENGDTQEKMVDENYKINKDFGDVKIEWEWIPEVYEGWKIKISDPIYIGLRPIPGQFKDINNIHHCKLPYYGVIYDNMNSQATSLMDRLKVYQYYYNIVMYRLELLLASDKGKKVLMNIGAVPNSADIDLEKWQYFFESTNMMWFDPSEEGNNYADANTIAKVIDLSLVSDIQKYIEIAEYLRTQAGRSVGITDPVEGQIGPNEAVTNVQQSLVQSSHVLENYFEMHNYVKRNVLEGLLERAKVCYSEGGDRKLSYVLDDMSVEMFTLDVGLLDNTTVGLFISNSARAEEVKETLRQLSHAAMQNQTVELSDVISVIRQDSIIEAEETLKVAEENRFKREQEAQQQALEAQAQEAEMQREFKREEHEMDKEIVILKEEERRKTVIAQAALVGLSFNPEVDQDNDGVPDFLEIAKHGVDAEIKRGKQQLEREKFEHEKKQDQIDNENEKEKLKLQRAKNQQKSVKP